MIKPVDDIPVCNGESRSSTSWFIILARKLQFFSKVGLVAWPLIGLGFILADILDELKKPTETITEWINLFMVLLYAIELVIVPVTMFKLERSAPTLFTKRQLRPPLNAWFMLLPAAINAISKLYLAVVTYHYVANQPTGDIVLWCAIQIGRLLGTSVYYSLPPIFFGVMVSNFMDKCEEFNKTRDSLNPYMVQNKGNELLEVYLKVHKGSQFGLFTQFSIKTLLIISLGFLLSVSGKCLSLDFVLMVIYVTALVTSVLILTYFGFIMDDCYQRFQGTADTLRALYVRSNNIQLNKELLDLAQKIEKQASFSALGFFSVDRSTLMAELGTILTYFIILIQADIC